MTYELMARVYFGYDYIVGENVVSDGMYGGCDLMDAITFDDKAKAVRAYYNLSNAFKKDGFIGTYLHEKYPDVSWFDADYDLFDEDEETVLSGCSYLWESEEHRRLY